MDKPLRVTIMLDAKVAQKYRMRQAKAIKKQNRSVSFSEVINKTLSRF